MEMVQNSVQWWISVLVASNLQFLLSESQSVSHTMQKYNTSVTVMFLRKPHKIIIKCQITFFQ